VVVGASRSETTAPTVIRARTVEAQDFLLKDAQGRVRARWSSHPATGIEAKVGDKVYQMPGEPALQFFNRNGEEVWGEPRQTLFQPIK
jgi:hypothetical protein